MSGAPSIWISLLISILLFPGHLWASEELDHTDLDAPEHDYWFRELNDPFTKLKDQIASGKLGLDTSDEKAYLVGLLEVLDIPVTSQILVFSTTSLQLRFISPRTPRAIYFNEDLYLGYIPGGRIEVISLDPELGGIFYIFDIPKQDGPVLVERSDRCMNCHAGSESGRLPGLVIKSVVPGPRGGSMESFRRDQTGHQIPFSERFGGWYLTGEHNIDEHWANVIGNFQDGELVTQPVEPGQLYDWDVYPVATSDVLAHLLHEHQAGFANLAVECSYRTRSYLKAGNGSLSREHLVVLDELADRMVRYLTFAEEAEFPREGMQVDSAYLEAFRASRREASNGRSLKDFNLESRMFELRCSYMIYSNTFQGLPEVFRNHVYRKLATALDLRNGETSWISSSEKQAILTVLRETLSDLPEDW